MNVGQKIRAARQAAGYTQEQLGEMLGVQKSAVSKWERNEVKNIKRSMLAKISKALNIRPADLIGTPADVVPSNVDLRLQRMISAFCKLSESQQETLIQIAEALRGKKGQ